MKPLFIIAILMLISFPVSATDIVETSKIIAQQQVDIQALKKDNELILLLIMPIILLIYTRYDFLAKLYENPFYFGIFLASIIIVSCIFWYPNKIANTYDNDLFFNALVTGDGSVLSKYAERQRNTLLNALQGVNDLSVIYYIAWICCAISVIATVLISVYMATETEFNFLKFIPALSAQLLAFYFLKLFHLCLNEKKYIYNELANFDYKYAAVQMALSHNDKALNKIVIQEFLKTERNFVLKKGESTVGLEAAKAMPDYVKNMMKFVDTMTNHKNNSKS